MYYLFGNKVNINSIYNFIYTIYKKIPLFGQDFFGGLEIPLNLMFNKEKT